MRARGAGAARGCCPGPVLGVRRVGTLRWVSGGLGHALLYVEAANRLELLVDLFMIITDINISMESEEFDTEGLLAKAKFHVSYKVKVISKPPQQVLANIASTNYPLMPFDVK
ncbi:hypothetical protein QJS10_CPA02g00969 [Acorus calamus]|uniref:Uncharacterized protein n=1 Tax=Acorus calamus TaxID=4465 RepID=A0AAV9FE15_ACOCL|nr:hypothetical protein QJS10_CPA02g00969 [Acorus calamus]